MTNISLDEYRGQVGKWVRRVDRQTNALPTNLPSDRPTDTASYRGALAHLKSVVKLEIRHLMILSTNYLVLYFQRFSVRLS